MAKILIVDDIADNRQILRFDLEDDHHKVIEAADGYACLEQIKSDPPDLILLDMMMPVLSGLEVLQRLKALPANSNIPVIMVSANDTDDLIISALDIGAHDYVSKPVIYPVLAARIRSALRLKEAQEELSKANSALQQLASTDTLTGLYNRRHFINLAAAEISRARRYSRPVSLMMLDADHFKALNDTYGHAAGDQALIHIANTCRRLCRESDIIGRIGGEEFLICCPDTGLPGTCELAERIINTIPKRDASTAKNLPSFTLSIGATQYLQGNTLDEFMAKADAQLYRAKNAGRNQLQHA